MISIEDEVKKVYKTHLELHGKNGIVDYALLDDCVRKIKATKEKLKPIVDKVIKESK